MWPMVKSHYVVVWNLSLYTVAHMCPIWSGLMLVVVVVIRLVCVCVCMRIVCERTLVRILVRILVFAPCGSIYTNFICRPTISGLWENPMFWNLSTVFYQTEWHRDWFGERLKPMFRDLSRSKVRESEEGGENRKDKNRKCKGGTSSIVF